MFCSACGNTINENLRFCNKCGAKTGKARTNDSQINESSFNFLIAAMLGLPIAGIGLLIGLTVVLKKELGFPDGMIMVIVLSCLMLFLIIEIGFLNVLFYWLRKSKQTDVAAVQFQPTLSTAQTRTLDEARSVPVSTPVGSVTEHTTRNFAPIDREN